MPTFICILRGINVSGHKLIKMKELQLVFERLGFNNVRTYIQSGNIVFECNSKEPRQLENSIAREISESFGFEVPVMVIEKNELKSVSGRNVFIAAGKEDTSKLHITFLAAEPEQALADSIGKEEYLPDEFCISGKAVFLSCPNGYGNTKLSNNFFEKKLKVQATTRNWKTVLELVKISEELT